MCLCVAIMNMSYSTRRFFSINLWSLAQRERERALPDKHIDKMVIKTIDKYGLLFCMHFLIHIQLSCIQYVTHFVLSVEYEINMLVSGPNLPKQSFYLIRVQYILWKFQRSVININLQQIFFYLSLVIIFNTS